MRRTLGLDRPLAVQYGAFLAAALRGDLGTSFYHGVPAMGLVLERLPATLELILTAMLLALLVAVPAGVAAARRPGSPVDRLARAASLLGISAPPFWIGIMLILVFAVELRWLPSSGRGTAAHLVLPAASLALYRVALFTRLVRAGMLEALSQDYVRTARAKGVPEGRLLFGHALKNTLIPVVTVAGLQMGSLFAGAIVTERIFAWPGMGRLILEAITKLDYPVVVAWALVVAAAFVAVNLLFDCVYSLVDPRVRLR
jgi:peptide/nickel transport system permease protein